MEYVFDSGAYGAFKPQGYLVGPKEAAGPYNIPNVFIEEKIVYTNKIPCGHMRAPGDPQGFFANESQMDLIARQLEMDPVAFRKMNLMRDGDISPIGHAVPHIKSDEIVDEAVRASGYRRAETEIFRPRHGALPNGCRWAASATRWLRSMLKAMLRFPRRCSIRVRERIRQCGWWRPKSCKFRSRKSGLLRSTPARSVPDTGIGASRGTRIFGNATRLAAAHAKEQLLDAASNKLGVAKDALRLSGDGAVSAACGREHELWRDRAQWRRHRFSGHGFYKNFESGPEAALCVQVAEVEVDPETGQVELKQFTTAHSTGTVLNPLMHQGQIDGGVVMGMGYALMEGGDDRRRQSGHDQFRRQQDSLDSGIFRL